MKSEMDAEGLQVLWARSSDVLATPGEDSKASYNFFFTTSLGSLRFPLLLLSQPGSFLGLFHLAKSPVVEDDLKAILAVLNFRAF